MAESPHGFYAIAPPVIEDNLHWSKLFWLPITIRTQLLVGQESFLWAGRPDNTPFPTTVHTNVLGWYICKKTVCHSETIDATVRQTGLLLEVVVRGAQLAGFGVCHRPTSCNDAYAKPRFCLISNSRGANRVSVAGSNRIFTVPRTMSW